MSPRKVPQAEFFAKLSNLFYIVDQPEMRPLLEQHDALIAKRDALTTRIQEAKESIEKFQIRKNTTESEIQQFSLLMKQGREKYTQWLSQHRNRGGANVQE